MEDHQLKVFTLEQAHQILPRLTGLLEELRSQRVTIHALEVEIDSLELVVEKDEHGISPAVSAKVDTYTRAVNHFYGLIEEIHGTGCFLKDVDLGLIDFYFMHEGRIVYLCWKLGESEASHWHEVDKGYSSRQPFVKGK